MKKGVSEMVAYVLLVVIAISISVLMFVYIKNFVPQEKVSCPEEVSLIISDVKCDSDQNFIMLSVLNKGTFNVTGFVIKASNSDRAPTIPLGVEPYIAPPSDEIGWHSMTTPGQVYFVNLKSSNLEDRQLAPGKSVDNMEFKFNPGWPEDVKSISIQPTWGDDDLLCRNSIITEKLTCVPDP